MEIISHYNHVLLVHEKHITECKKPTINYFSHKIPNEIICIMGQQMRETIFVQIKILFNYISIINLIKNKCHKQSDMSTFLTEKY